jgi:hypothetical protein
MHGTGTEIIREILLFSSGHPGLLILALEVHRCITNTYVFTMPFAG